MAILRTERMASSEPTSATNAQESQQRIFEHRRNADRLAHQKKSESQRFYKVFFIISIIRYFKRINKLAEVLYKKSETTVSENF